MHTALAHNISKKRSILVIGLCLLVSIESVASGTEKIMPVPAILGTIGSAILGGVTRGLTTGISSRIGKKIDRQPSVSPTVYSAASPREYATAQETSQGQQSSVARAGIQAQENISNAGIASRERMQLRQHIHERAMRYDPFPMSMEGQPSEGEAVSLQPLSTKFNRLATEYNPFKNWPTDKGPNRPIPDIGMTRSGRHYGSTW